MKIALVALLCSVFSLVASGALAQSAKARLVDSTEGREEARQLKRETKALAEDIAVLRRDQINYKLDKDLLKDAYASNLERIQLTVTIIFGIITALVAVFGFLGVKSIKDVRADYTKELDELKKLRTKLEGEIEGLARKQTTVEETVEKITKTNEQQDRRLQVLELTEKITRFYQDNQHYWALQYLGPALELDPNNGLLLRIKAGCHSKLGDIDQCINTWKRCLEISPKDEGVQTNLMEVLLVANRVKEYDELIAVYKDATASAHGGALQRYFNILRALAQSDVANVKAEILAIVASAPDQATNRLGTWTFGEAEHAVKALPDGQLKKTMQVVINYLSGQITGTQLKAELTAL